MFGLCENSFKVMWLVTIEYSFIYTLNRKIEMIPSIHEYNLSLTLSFLVRNEEGYVNNNDNIFWNDENCLYYNILSISFR